MHERDGKKAGGPQPKRPPAIGQGRFLFLVVCSLAQVLPSQCVDLSLSCDCRSRTWCFSERGFFLFLGWLVTKLKRETCVVSQFKHPRLQIHIKFVCSRGGGRGVSIKSGHDEDVGDWIGLFIKKKRLTSNWKR